MKTRQNIPTILISIFVLSLVLINLAIGIRIFRDPNPFPSSYWDIRWAFLFAAAFFSVGFLFFLMQGRLLLLFSFIGAGFLIILPVFTTGAGPSYLVLLLLVVIAWGAGESLLQLLLGDRVRNGLERFALAALLGMGLVAILVMIQGWLGAYHLFVTWPGLTVLFALFVLPKIKLWFLDAKGWFLNLRRLWSKADLSGFAFAFGVLAILWIPPWLIALAPATRYDEMSYHLTGPLLYLREGGIVPYPEGGNNVWLHYAEMLYTLALQTAGQPLPRLLHLMMGLMSVLLVFLFGRRLVNARIGAVAAILFFAVPAVGYETGTAYIDLFVTAYTTAAVFTLLLWWQEENARWLLAAGVLGGIALGIKLTAGPVLFVMVCVLFLAAFINHRLRTNVKWFAVMGGLIVCLALPWLVRDTLWTGDPFHPYGTMFLHRFTESSTIGSVSGQPALLEKASQILIYPFILVFNSYRYYHEAAGGMASVLPLLALPLFFFSPYLSRFTKILATSLLAASIAAVGIMIIVNNGLIRYALPVFPWLAICAALNLEVIYCWFTERHNRYSMPGLIILALVYLFSTRLPLIVRIYENLPQRLPVSYILGRESKEEYLSKNLVVYDAFRYIDSQPGGPHRVLSIGNEFRLYSQSRIDGVYDVQEADRILSGSKTPASLANSLAQLGYDFILINQLEAEFRPWKYIDPYPILQETDFLNLYGEMVFAQEGIYVYRFEPSGTDLPQAVNLLNNSSFEDFADVEGFAYWEEFGPIEVSENAYQGKVSLVLSAPLSEQGSSYVFQKVPVDEEKIYTLAYWTYADKDAIFLMQIRWLNDQGNVISTEQQWKNVVPQWRQFTLNTTSPKGARFAEVYASLGGANSALVDEVCLALGQRCPIPNLVE